jgi:4a-hydroxytetrahydrobiopterin dehydratase
VTAVGPQRFHASAGVEDWRMLFDGVSACYRTRSYGASVALVGAIGALAGDGSGRPDVDLRPDGLTVRIPQTPEAGITEDDVELARKISAAARAAGARADPAALQVVQVAIDALVSADVLPFWRAVLGYDEVGGEDLLDPRRRGPAIWFQEMDAPRPQRNRIHVDLSVPHDQAEARVAAAVAAGGRVVFDRHAPTWWTLADPEGNEVDIATMLGRG